MKRILLLFLFSLLIVLGTGEIAKSVEKGKNWEFGGKKAYGAASASNTAEDGRSLLNISCNQWLGRTVSGSLNGYTGDALTKIDDQQDSVIFEIMDANGKLLSFDGKFNYYAPDRAWNYHGYPLGLLDAFEHGQKLTLRNGKGVMIAQFNLNGAAQARAFLKDTCGF